MDEGRWVRMAEGEEEGRWRELAEGWLGRLGSERARGQFRRILNFFLAWLGKEAGRATEEDGRAWAEWLKAERYAASTIYTYLTAVASFYSHAAAQRPELGLENPGRAYLRREQKLLKDVKRLSRAEMERALQAVDREALLGKRDYALIALLMETAWPHEAARQVRWGDFEVSQQGARCSRLAARIKQADGADAEEERCWARLEWRTWGAIVEYLEARGRPEADDEEAFIFTPLVDKMGRIEKLYGPDWERRALSKRELSRVLARAAKRAGIARGKLTPTNLRRSAALLRWQEGASVEEVQRLLDHQRRRVTVIFLMRAGVWEGKEGRMDGNEMQYRSEKRRMRVEEAREAEIVEEEVGATGAGRGLEAEVELLRGTMRELGAARRRAATLEEQMRIAQVISLVGERLAQMLLAEKKLGERSGDELEIWLQETADEVLREHGWGDPLPDHPPKGGEGKI